MFCSILFCFVPRDINRDIIHKPRAAQFRVFLSTGNWCRGNVTDGQTGRRDHHSLKNAPFSLHPLSNRYRRPENPLSNNIVDPEAGVCPHPEQYPESAGTGALPPLHMSVSRETAAAAMNKEHHDIGSREAPNQTSNTEVPILHYRMYIYQPLNSCRWKGMEQDGEFLMSMNLLSDVISGKRRTRHRNPLYCNGFSSRNGDQTKIERVCAM